MKTIALLTDFGLNDNFVGVIKGVILKINPWVNIVDISHNIETQDIYGGAFLLKSSYKYFPKGTIFLVVIDPGVGSRRRPIIIRSKNYIFIGPDNGALSLATAEDGIKSIVAIENKRYFLKPVSDTFHGRDIFAPVAACLSKDMKPGSFGRRFCSMIKLDIPKPEQKQGLLKGKIIHIDRFGNLVTNVDENLFRKFIKDKNFNIKIKNKEVNSVVKFYQAVKPGELLAIFGSFGFLELSVNAGNAKEYLDAEKGDLMWIEIL